jgi:hypothetical protein
MTRLTLDSLLSGYNSVAALNENFAKIALEFDKPLYRSGSVPNAMAAPIDMNSNRIINLGAPASDNDAVRYVDLLNGVSTTDTIIPSPVGQKTKLMSSTGTSYVFIEDISTHEFETIVAAASEVSVAEGDVLLIKDRANSYWDTVLTSGVTPNTYDVYVSSGTPALSLVLRTDDVADIRAFGIKGDGSDESAAFQHVIDTGFNIDLFGLEVSCNNITQSTNFQTISSSFGLGRITKNASGDLFTSFSNDNTYTNINWRGDNSNPVFTGHNIVGSGARPIFINCGSRWAYGRALKWTGDRVSIYGTGDLWHTADGAGTPSTAYDIEIGSDSAANLYSYLENVVTSQSAGGILLKNVGSHVISGGVFGKLYIQKVGVIGGINGGKNLGARILGDVNIEIPTALFSGCQFSNVTVTLESTSNNCKIDESNSFQSGATVVNNGNNNNYVVRQVGSGIVDIKYGDDTDVARMTVVPSTGDFEYFGDLATANGKAFKFRNFADTGYHDFANISTSDRISLSNSSSTITTILAGAQSIDFTVAGATQWQVTPTALRPFADNSDALGSASNRPTQLFAISGTINTSDEREKQNINKVPDTWLDAWANVEIINYKWIDAVGKKGTDARKHIGIIAQSIERAFKDEGLDAFELGLLCYDVWDAVEEVLDTDGSILTHAVIAGDRYGIRSDQCLFLEAALNKRERSKLEKRISKLEGLI